jgi:hypothetical protein
MQEPKANIYLKGNSMSRRTVMQVLNILRSKLTYEPKLLITRGAAVAWHDRAQPLHDGTTDIERLATYASEHLDLPIGDPEQVDLSGNFPNDPLPTHDGLTKWDYTAAAPGDSSASSVSTPKVPSQWCR